MIYGLDEKQFELALSLYRAERFAQEGLKALSVSDLSRMLRSGDFRKFLGDLIRDGSLGSSISLVRRQLADVDQIAEQNALIIPSDDLSRIAAIYGNRALKYAEQGYDYHAERDFKAALKICGAHNLAALKASLAVDIADVYNQRASENDGKGYDYNAQQDRLKGQNLASLASSS